MLAAASARASPAAARGLDADDFRHPLDKQASLLFPSVYTVRLRDGNMACNFPSSEKFTLSSLLRQNTLLLRAIPGLNDVGKALLGHHLYLYYSILTP